MLRYSVLLHRNRELGVYGVIVPELPGVFTQGDTFEEALAMARDAIELHLEGMLADGEEIPVEDEPLILASVEVPEPAHVTTA